MGTWPKNCLIEIEVVEHVGRHDEKGNALPTLYQVGGSSQYTCCSRIIGKLDIHRQREEGGIVIDFDKDGRPYFVVSLIRPAVYNEYDEKISDATKITLGERVWDSKSEIPSEEISYCPFCGKKFEIRVNRRKTVTYTYKKVKKSLLVEEESTTTTEKKVKNQPIEWVET